MTAAAYHLVSSHLSTPYPLPSQPDPIDLPDDRVSFSVDPSAVRQGIVACNDSVMVPAVRKRILWLGPTHRFHTHNDASKRNRRCVPIDHSWALGLMDRLGKPFIRFVSVHFRFICLSRTTLSSVLELLAVAEICESPNSPLRLLPKVLAGDLSGPALSIR